MTEAWTSLHVFHRGGTDLLIVETVGTLVRSLEADGLLDRYFFLRYWEGGPHLRLRLRPVDGARVGDRARTALERHLAAHPTTASWDPERYALAARSLARAEELPYYDRRLRHTDTVEDIPYRPEYAVFGGPEATDAVERHFTDSSRIALAVLGHTEDPERRLGFALAALMLALTVCDPGHDRIGGALERTRDRWDPPATARAGRADAFTRQRTALSAQAARCRRIAADPAPHGLLGAWARSIGTLHREILTLRADGRFHPAPADSSFHPGPDPHGDVLILLLRCVHLLCNRLGLSSPQEAHLRYLTAMTFLDLKEPR
ncbi:lantibiotic dehydratase C-terminal domain-containing protein [Streptomyces sp. NPDC056716]|uniref:lantibiotic dehydratase C-terminal domain-containing protein n=1 Tax=unclassified Streptomyces TaxID=2593676 RepID=UPI0036BC8648